MTTQVDTLARFAAQLDILRVPQTALDRAKLVLLDTIGVILAGSMRPEVQELQSRLAASEGALIYGPSARRSDIRTAALLNGIAGRSIELCDGMRFVSSQPSVQMIPALLALSEMRDASGADFLVSMIAGYEVTGRLATGFKSRPTAHQNGQVPLLGAVAATCRLNGFSPNQMSEGLRIGANLLMTPSYLCAIQGATGLNVPGGMSCHAATLVPTLVACGFTGMSGGVEESLGALVGDSFDSSCILHDLGSRWEICRNYFRMHAACNPMHPALDALCKAISQTYLRPQDIESIEFSTFGFAAQMRNPDPGNFLASKYSLPHAAATRIVRGGTSHGHIDDASLLDPEIVQLRRKVTVREDPAMTAVTPGEKPARVKVTLKDGSILAAEVRSHRGDLADPYPESAIRTKFRDLAGTALAGNVMAIEKAIDKLEFLPSMRKLADLVANLNHTEGPTL